MRHSEAAPQVTGRSPVWRRWHVWIAAVSAAIALAAMAAGYLSGYEYGPLDASPEQAVVPALSEETPDVRLKALRRQERSLRTKVARAVPRGPYIVIDRTHNKLYLRVGSDIVLTAICSAGSGATLVDPGGARQWTFATPRGRFTVQSKITDPVWRKPDWAFIEAGQPVPTNPVDRLEYGSLGEYALYLGDGYMIHGTLYERLLGRSVSHGCVRLAREDLRKVYAASRVGTAVFIF